MLAHPSTGRYPHPSLPAPHAGAGLSSPRPRSPATTIMVIQVPEIPARPVPIVRLIVPDALGRALVLRRAAGSTGAGRWCLPGGKIDYGDTAEQAATRELEEETGLRVVALTFLFYQDSLPSAPGRMHCINLYFACKVEGDFALNYESTAAAWIGPADLHHYQLTFRNDDALIRYWQQHPPQERPS